MNKKEIALFVAFLTLFGAVAICRVTDMDILAKVAKVKSDFSVIGAALEAYKVDYNRYPPDYNEYQFSGRPEYISAFVMLTTPIAYMKSIPQNPFPYLLSQPFDGEPQWYGYKSTAFLNIVQDWVGHPHGHNEWVLFTNGPDGRSNHGEYILFGEEYLNTVPGGWFDDGPGCLYDPTNGLISDGDITRTNTDRVSSSPLSRTDKWTLYH